MAVASLGSECQLTGRILLHNASVSFKELMDKLSAHLYPEEKNLSGEQVKRAAELARNTLGMLVKHNLVRSWQGEYDLVTHYSLDSTECILRLSLPRYLVKVGSEMSPVHLSILEALVVHGSLLKSEVIALLTSTESIKRPALEKALDELIQSNFVTGAQVSSPALSEDKPVKKRLAKEEEKLGRESEEFPVRVNLLKLLGEERRKCVVDFAREKVSGD